MMAEGEHAAERQEGSLASHTAVDATSVGGIHSDGSMQDVLSSITAVDVPASDNGRLIVTAMMLAQCAD